MQVLFVSHDGLASGMKKGLEFIAGKNNEISVVELNKKGIEDFKDRILKVINEFKKGEKIILLSDIPAGSPGTTAYEFLLKKGFKVKYIAGVNLPFLIQFALSKDVNEALKEGKNNLKDMTEIQTKKEEDIF